MNLTKRHVFLPLRSRRSATLCEAVTVVILLIIVVLAFILSGCNVTRTVTTTAQTVQKGDTTVVIMTKTIEQYDGAVDAAKLLKATGY